MRYILKDNIGTILASIAQAPQDGSTEVIIQEYKSKRSLDQNAYFHSCLRDIAKYTGHTAAEAKVIVKFKLGLYHTIEGKNDTLLVYDDTHSMSVDDMSAVIEQTLQLGAEWGVRFSVPDYDIEFGV